MQLSRHNAALAACRAALEEKRRQLSAMDAVRDAAQITLRWPKSKRIRIARAGRPQRLMKRSRRGKRAFCRKRGRKAAAQQMFAAKEAKNALSAGKDLSKQSGAGRQTHRNADAFRAAQALWLRPAHHCGKRRRRAAIHGGNRRARRTSTAAQQACRVRDQPQQRLCVPLCIRARHDARRDHSGANRFFSVLSRGRCAFAAQAGQKKAARLRQARH